MAGDLHTVVAFMAVFWQPLRRAVTTRILPVLEQVQLPGFLSPSAKGFNLIGHHEILVPLLRLAVLTRLSEHTAENAT